MVIVDGEIVMRGGELTCIDEPEILAEIAAEHATLRPLLDEAERRAEPINEAYRRIYARCLKEPIAADTYPARL